MKINLNIDGTKSSTVEISDKLVNLKVNHKLINIIDWQLNHAKPRTAKQNKEINCRFNKNCSSKRKWRRSSRK